MTHNPFTFRIVKCSLYKDHTQLFVKVCANVAGWNSSINHVIHRVISLTKIRNQQTAVLVIVMMMEMLMMEMETLLMVSSEHDKFSYFFNYSNRHIEI